MKSEISRGETTVAGPRYGIAVLQKALDTLEIVAFARGSLTLQQIADRSKLPKATVFRLLANLVDRGYVHRTDEGTFRLGGQVRLINLPSSERAHLLDAARPHMRSLRDRYGHTVSLATRLAQRVLYIEALEGTQSLRFVEPIGATGPLHATALGKALLAWADEGQAASILGELPYEPFTAATITSAAELRLDLQRIRERGYAVDDEESMSGARCVAVPIFDRSGLPTAAMSVSAPVAGLDWGTAAEVGARLRGYCREISDTMREEAHPQ